MTNKKPIKNPHDALFRGVFADPQRAAELLDSVLSSQLEELVRLDPASRREARYEKFRKLGRFGQSKFL